MLYKHFQIRKTLDLKSGSLDSVYVSILSCGPYCVLYIVMTSVIALPIKSTKQQRVPHQSNCSSGPSVKFVFSLSSKKHLSSCLWLYETRETLISSFETFSGFIALEFGGNSSGWWLCYSSIAVFYYKDSRFTRMTTCSIWNSLGPLLSDFSMTLRSAASLWMCSGEELVTV